MYKLAFLEPMADAYMRKRAGMFGSLADKVNFAANAKVLSDMTNEALSKRINDRDGDGIPDDRQKDEPKKVSILLTGDLKDRLTDEQRRRLVAIARQISADRKAKRK